MIVSEISCLWYRKLWTLEPFMYLFKKNLLSIEFVLAAVLGEGDL